MTYEYNENNDGEQINIEVTDAASEPVNGEMLDWNNLTSKHNEMSRESTMFDIDRMVNEGLGGGNVTEDNGMIGDTTTDTMVTEDEMPRSTENRKEHK